MRVAALLLALGCAEPGEIDSGPGRWKVDFTLSLLEKEGRWSFMIDGTTDLPVGTVLQARVYVLEIQKDPIQGPVEDTEPLVGQDDAFQSAFHAFQVAGPKFSQRVHAFKRKPYSLSYRAIVTYAAEDQTDALALKVGDGPFSRKADLRVGKEADFAAELQVEVRGIGQDLMALEKTGAELAEWIGRAGKDPAGWSAWKEPAGIEIESLQGKNLHRFNVWAIWPEYQGRMRIGGLSEFLERIIDAVEDPQAGELKIRRWMAGFVDSLDEAYTVIGFEPPLDGRKAGPVLAAYERAVKPVLEGKADQFRQARADGVSSLFAMLQLLRSRPRGYSYVNDVGLQLTRLVELFDDQAPASQLQDALARHDAALRELRKFAGLP